MRLENWNFLEFLSAKELDSFVEKRLISKTMSTMACCNSINKLVDLFFDTMRENIVHISRGGSFGKGTCLKSRSDIDMVLYVKEGQFIDDSGFDAVTMSRFLNMVKSSRKFVIPRTRK